MDTALPIVIFLIFVAALVWFLANATRSAARARMEALAERSTRIGATVDPRNKDLTVAVPVAGTYRGERITIDYASRGAGSYSENWTEISIDLPSDRWTLDLRPQTPDEERSVATGRARDVTLDDQSFDARFVVEGGPADVVKHALDAGLRARLCQREYTDGRTRDGKWIMGRREWIEDDAALRELLDLAVDVKQAMDAATRALAQADRERMPVGGGFRDGVDAAAVDANAAARANDVLEVRATRTRREDEDQRRSAMVLVGVLCGVLLCIVVAVLLIGN